VASTSNDAPCDSGLFFGRYPNRTKEGMFTNINDFTADKFSPTTWEPSKKKSQFAKTFIRFAEADFPRRQFTKSFYHRLALTFGHIAHYDVFGFYDHFFTSTAGKVRFLRQTLQWPCYGDPAFTYSDVERALQSWLAQNNVLAKYEQRLAEEREAAEKQELVRLQVKYGG
jgi:hypothetical protein